MEPNIENSSGINSLIQIIWKMNWQKFPKLVSMNTTKLFFKKLSLIKYF